MLHCGQVIRWRGRAIWNRVSHLITSFLSLMLQLGKTWPLFSNSWVRSMIFIPHIKRGSSLSNVGFRANWGGYFIDTIFHFIDCVYFFISTIHGFVDCSKARSLSCFFNSVFRLFIEQYGCIQFFTQTFII